MVKISNRIDPKLHRCKCGMRFRPGVFHRVLMLVFGEYSWRCPRCHTVLKFRLVHHVVKTDVVMIKERDLIWKKG